MRFEEPRINTANFLDPQAVYLLIVEDLCGEKYHRPFNETDRAHLTRFLKLASQEGLTYERFNELLLLVDQDRVSEPFYRFFFSAKDPFKLVDLAQCVINFRGYAMLCYGDFRFAYKQLSTKPERQLKRRLRPFWDDAATIESRYQARPPGVLRVERIHRQDTWCLGYIAGIKYDKESELAAKMLTEAPDNSDNLELGELYKNLGEKIQQTRVTALGNTDVYLTWDFMDVYIATSMRKQWEFEDVATFVVDLFSDKRLRALKLRYFDPTQSDCTSRIDKGLVEALMLKRASCTIYLVQESDTLGKDSELASTLAQGKPVIAFVPNLNINDYARKIKGFPLEFFKIRFRVLQAEGVFEQPELKEQLSAIDPQFTDTVNEFLDRVEEFSEAQPFTLWETKQTGFKNELAMFDIVCQLLATAEKYNFDKRATVLKSVHPLSLQVHLESGVANGVLVVRTVQECTELLYNLLINALSFVIEFDARNKCTVLRERICQSPFRAVTEHEKLANSFWNFYLMKDKEASEDE
jgi:hypothetical protein